ncbi:class I SAM-dependent methyltransferase [Desulfatitalea alkaliphila]|uniref:Methyltransferase domain-containing protein n=1 Tax=Desulfatitalea alkaliphila TaxID=2929485 RepID=A0AA41R4X6_9BACT|nr:methyltransferase domain-containing protein [Desulfatitalea alkaliphila]MCJ8502419.1 methyltransferase domain-containing protein [Desulfatitalea alkaliphila]
MRGAGKSSYDLIDSERFWKAIGPLTGHTILDLACGAGRYTLPLAEAVGPAGRVVAVDLWTEGLAQLEQAARGAGRQTIIETHALDVTQALPLAGGSVDLCLMATILHDLAADGVDAAALAEVARVLKPDGRVAVVEFIPQEGPPGPPKAVRLSLADVTRRMMARGLIRFGAVVELGPHTYFAQFGRLKGARG